eukprot:TRINITY_DN781996_c0_g1_i1.p1 TRINITY_DN781996_c0_g1~~TRINITY_DN781996_c0_g1_i1.p1  ORF type:complete len:141 (-),score=52.81 TRINITY_DN781996_c0_g1_i1:200-586(-)
MNDLARLAAAQNKKPGNAPVQSSKPKISEEKPVKTNPPTKSDLSTDLHKLAAKAKVFVPAKPIPTKPAFKPALSADAPEFEFVPMPIDVDMAMYETYKDEELDEMEECLAMIDEMEELDLMQDEMMFQ